MLTIWGRLNSHNVKKVAWFADELDLDYQRIDVGGQFGMDEAYLAKNPNAMIPTIEDGPLVLWESNVILRYLAAQYGGERWWPADPARRAIADRWMDWQVDYGEAQRRAFIGYVRTPEDRRNHAAIDKSVAAAANKLEVLEHYLGETPWLSGDQFGVGDIPMGVYAWTWFSLPIERPEYPRISDWFARLRERPGYVAQVAIPLS